MKYRIKAVTDKNGNTTYYPQQKGFIFGWNYMQEYMGMHATYNKTCKTLREAESYIEDEKASKEYHKNKKVITNTEIVEVD